MRVPVRQSAEPCVRVRPSSLQAPPSSPAVAPTVAPAVAPRQRKGRGGGKAEAKRQRRESAKKSIIYTHIYKNTRLHDNKKRLPSQTIYSICYCCWELAPHLSLAVRRWRPAVTAAAATHTARAALPLPLPLRCAAAAAALRRPAPPCTARAGAAAARYIARMRPAAVAALSHYGASTRRTRRSLVTSMIGCAPPVTVGDLAFYVRLACADLLIRTAYRCGGMRRPG